MRWLRRYGLVACLLCLGFWPLGQSAYIPAKAWLAQDLMQRAWERAGDGEDAARPWPWADMHPLARLYAGDGRVNLIVLSGSSGRTLAFGPGHLEASAVPGEPGNAIIAGHRDTHFRFLEDVRRGEVMVIERPDGRQYLYEVIGTDVVDSRRGSLLLDTEKAYLTLVTCYPFDAIDPGGPLRYVVTLKKRL